MAVPPYVTAGDVIEEAWGDQVANSLVNPFGNAAVRSAAIALPTNGMLCAITSANSANGIEQYNGVNWRKPWNMPWGEVGYFANTTTGTQAMGGSTTVVTGLTGAYDSVDNRLYRVTFQVNQSGTSAVGLYQVQDNGVTVGDTGLQPVTVGTTPVSSTGVVRFVTTATGPRTLRLVGTNLAGSAVLNVNSSARQFILIEDMGPGGPPV